MSSNNGKKGKKSNLYYIVVALFLILSGALGGNQLEESVQDSYVSDISDVAEDSQVVENEVSDTTEDSQVVENEVSDMTEESQDSENEAADIQNNEEDAGNSKSDSTETEVSEEETELEEVEILYTFRYRNNLDSHYEKHGIEMGFDSPEEYLAAANKALANPDILHKIEAEDGDDVYYLEATNEFIVVSTDGYIRTYYYPTDGIDYFNRQ